MVRFRLKELISDKNFKENRRVTLKKISEATGIHKTTLSKIQSKRGYTTTTDTLEKLCLYLECSFDDLMEIVEV